MLCCLTHCQSSGSAIIHWFNNVKDKFEKREINRVVRGLATFLFRLFTIFRCIRLEFWRRQNNIYPSNLIEHNTSSHPLAVEATSEEDRVLPCIQRLQRLEKVFDELNNKPAEIPLEKEKLLMESLDRIKNVEFDLEKTKRVCSF